MKRSLRVASQVIGMVGGLVLAIASGGMDISAADAHPQRSVRIQFVPPEFDAVYSLAVFDSAGARVRLLRSLAPSEEFEIALNGLAVFWDGADDSGNPLPAGPYHVKGYAVPLVRVQGVAFHFNDWVEDRSGARPARILDIAWSPEGALLAIYATARDGGAGERTDDTQNPRPSTGLLRLGAAGDPGLIDNPIDNSKVLPGARQLSGSTAGVFYLAEGEGLFVSAEGTANPTDLAGIASVIFLSDSRLLAAEGRSVSVFGLDGKATAPASALPGEGKAIAAVGEARDGSLGALTNDGRLWRSPALSTAWEPWKIDGLEAPRDLAFSKDGSLWIADGGTTTPGIKQVGQDGAPGVWIPASEEGFVPVQLAVSSMAEEKIAVLEAGVGTQVVRVLEARPGQEPAWEETRRRAIIDSREFGLRDGVLVPDAGGTPPDHARIGIAENPLEPGKRRALDVVVHADDRGGVLGDAAGVPLARIDVDWSLGNLRRVALLRPDAASDALRIYVGDGSVVEEYEVAGLERTAVIDCGEYILDPPH